MDEKNYQYIFSLKLAGHLMINGCRLIRLNHHLSGNGKDVYVFEKTRKVEKIVNEYMKKAKEK